MADHSAIEWTDASWTIVTGCDVISPACGFCYARAFAPRLQLMERARVTKLLAENPDAQLPILKYQTDSVRPSSGLAFEVVCHPHLLDWPRKLKRPRRIFVTSMGDLFHERVPFAFLDRVFETMADTPHTYQVLTKRPARMREYFTYAADYMGLRLEDLRPWPNIWLGVTVENATWARRRLDDLKACPSPVHFLSVEPMLADIGWILELDDIEWVIGGGESGQHLAKAPHRFLVDTAGRPRADRQQWARNLRDACADAHVPFLWKQWGGRTPKAAGRELDGRTWDDMPAWATIPRVTSKGT